MSPARSVTSSNRPSPRFRSRQLKKEASVFFISGSFAPFVKKMSGRPSPSKSKIATPPHMGWGKYLRAPRSLLDR